MKQRISSGTLLVLAILALAVLIGIGRSVIKRMGDRFEPTTRSTMR